MRTVRGDAVGVEHRGELEHGAGQACRAELVGAFNGQGPGGSHDGGLVVGQCAGFWQQVGQLPDPVGRQLPVGGTNQVRIDGVGGGLGQRERQESQLGGQAADLVGWLVAVVRGKYGGEAGGGFLGGEQTHGHPAPACSGQGGRRRLCRHRVHQARVPPARAVALPARWVGWYVGRCRCTSGNCRPRGRRHRACVSRRGPSRRTGRPRNRPVPRRTDHKDPPGLRCPLPATGLRAHRRTGR